MPEASSYYDLLGVEPDASLSDIRDAYKRNAAKYHPDVNDASDAHVTMTMLNEAWETLRDPDRRKRYDHSLPKGPRSQRQRFDEERAEQQLREEARRAEIARAAREKSNRRRFVTIAVVVAFVGGWQLLSHHGAGDSQPTPGTAARTTSAPAFECVPAGTDLDQPIPLELSEAQYRELLKSYTAPVILGLRGALDSYLHGVSSDDATKLLSGTSRSILSKRFTLLAVSKGVFGGDFLILQFENEPTRIYKAWIFRGTSGAYELRGWDIADCNARQQQWIKATYGAVTTRLLHDLGTPQPDSPVSSRAKSRDSRQPAGSHTSSDRSLSFDYAPSVLRSGWTRAAISWRRRGRG